MRSLILAVAVAIGLSLVGACAHNPKAAVIVGPPGVPPPIGSTK